MDNKNGFLITDRDRVYKAWLNATEAVRDYRQFANELDCENGKLADRFARQAEAEGFFAAEMLKLLQDHDVKKING